MAEEKIREELKDKTLESNQESLQTESSLENKNGKSEETEKKSC